MEIYEKYLVSEDTKEDIKEIKRLLSVWNKKHKGNQSAIRREIQNNVVNNKYVHRSNDFITMMWSEFNKMFPS